MQNKKNSARIAELAIRRIIESLFKLLNAGRKILDKLAKTKERLDTLDKHNPDFFETIGDHRETMNFWLYLVLIIISFGIDYLLTYTATSILLDSFGGPEWLKIIIPAGLIIFELFISYIQISQQHIGEESTWMIRAAPYVVIIILGALTLTTIAFSIHGYIAGADGTNFWQFIVGSVLVQLVLLTASVLFHCWMIRHAEILVDTLAYFRYKIERIELTSKISKLQKRHDEHVQEFAMQAYKLVEKVDQFKRDYPDSNIDFEKTMPVDLAVAINNIMGKTIFPIE